MPFYSTLDSTLVVPFNEAVLTGLAPGGGLYVPKISQPFDRSNLAQLTSLPFNDAAKRILSRIIHDEVPSLELNSIVDSALDFPVPLVKLKEGISVLELFQGPSCAFKDFGARFLAYYLASVQPKLGKEIVVLTATSGDTGAAVAQAFHNRPGVRVFILYPFNRVSPIQELQIAALGGNIHAVAVDGSFDDCQSLVKAAFDVREIASKVLLTAANSINVGRLVPQVLYYFYAYMQVANKELPLYFSVPSGNLGNICAGIIAMKLGLPVKGFIAATNANDALPKYLSSGAFTPGKTVPTISNAMDVGHPNNFTRLEALLDRDLHKMRNVISGYAFDDSMTVDEILRCQRENDYLLDPHTAVGTLAMRQFCDENRISSNQANCIVLSTAHPAKFDCVLKTSCGIDVAFPQQLNKFRSLKPTYTRISNKLEELCKIVLNQI